MQPRSSNAPMFAAQQAPSSFDRAMAAYMDTQFRQIAAVLQQIALGHVDPTYVAPARPRDGDFRLAAAPWDPGSGPGFYYYLGGVWKPFAGTGGGGLASAPKLTAAPATPSDGNIVLAVAPWDPGSGDGFYGYRNGGWHFLG